MALQERTASAVYPLSGHEDWRRAAARGPAGVAAAGTGDQKPAAPAPAARNGEPGTARRPR